MNVAVPPAVYSCTDSGITKPARVALTESLNSGLIGSLDLLERIRAVPVAMNFDRVLEDRVLIRELVDEDHRPGRIAQLASVVHYLAWNLGRLAFGRLRLRASGDNSFRPEPVRNPTGIVPVGGRPARAALARARRRDFNRRPAAGSERERD